MTSNGILLKSSLAGCPVKVHLREFLSSVYMLWKSNISERPHDGTAGHTMANNRNILFAVASAWIKQSRRRFFVRFSWCYSWCSWFHLKLQPKYKSTILVDLKIPSSTRTTNTARHIYKNFVRFPGLFLC